MLDDYSYANPTMSNRVLERFARVIGVSPVRFYTKIDLKGGDTEFGYAKAAAGKDINFMVVEKSAVIKFDKHVASRVFSPDDLESLDDEVPQVRHRGALLQQARRRVRVGLYGVAVASTVKYKFYTDTYEGGLSEAAFAASLPTADAHVRWLCTVKGASTTYNMFKRAVCAAVDAFAEYGAGEVGGFQIGEFSVKNYASQQTAGEELATAAALRELGLTGMAFTGVC